MITADYIKENVLNCINEDYIPFISTYLNGFYAEADQKVWSAVQGGEYWMFQYGLIVFGLDSGMPKWCSKGIYYSV